MQISGTWFGGDLVISGVKFDLEVFQTSRILWVHNALPVYSCSWNISIYEQGTKERVFRQYCKNFSCHMFSKLQQPPKIHFSITPGWHIIHRWGWQLPVSGLWAERNHQRTKAITTAEQHREPMLKPQLVLSWVWINVWHFYRWAKHI